MKPSTDGPRPFSLGTTLFERGQTEEAIAALRCCLADAPDHVAASYNRGKALIMVGRATDAVDSLWPAITKLSARLRKDRQIEVPEPSRQDVGGKSSSVRHHA